MRSDYVRKYIVGDALEPFDFTIRRADTMNASGIITEQIVTELLNADLVVADLTDHNPNVFYELALRHAVKKPFIHMIKYGEKIPFDVATLRTIFYDTTNPDSMHDAKMSVRAAAKEIIDAGDEYQVISPVTIAIDLDKLRNSGDPNQIALADIQQSLASMENVVERLLLRDPDQRLPPTENRSSAMLAHLFERQMSEGRFASADLDMLVTIEAHDRSMSALLKQVRTMWLHFEGILDEEARAKDAARAAARAAQVLYPGGVNAAGRRMNADPSEDNR